MMSPEEFVVRWYDTKLAELDEEQSHAWGMSPLIRYDARIVENLPLPLTSQRFLSDAGLPKYAFYNWRFGYPSNTLAPITEAMEGWTFPNDYTRYRVLAADLLEFDQNGSPQEVIVSVICLDLERNGQVVNVSSLSGHPIEFLNSSVVQLAEFILLYREAVEWDLAHKLKLNWGTDYHLWEQESYTYNDKMVKYMLRIDPKAGQPGTGWHGVLSLGPQDV